MVLKLESLWILTNLAYGTSKDIDEIFSPQYGILNTINLILNSRDRAMIE
jgi:hypothetical protein